MRKSGIFFIALILLLAVPAGTAYAAAPPQLPDAFFGSVLINGAPAPDGTSVSATVNQGTVINNSQNPVATAGGSYGITSPPLLVQGNIPNGAAITFHVTNQNGTAIANTTATFQAGGGPTRRDLSVTIASPAPPPARSPGTTGLAGKVDSSGIFTSTVVAPSADGIASVTVDANVKGKTASGEPLTNITVTPMSSKHAPPKDAQAIAMTYDLGPSGATFDKPVTISLKYDPSALPPRITVSALYIAWWDTPSGQWLRLASRVDTTNNIITATIDHFTEFTVFASTRPAAFGISNLNISPAEVEAGRTVTISSSVTNTGDLAGTCTVTLKMDNAVITTRDVTLAGQASQPVTFTASKDTAGTYQVDVNGLTGSVNVKPVTVPTPTPMATPTPSISWLTFGIIAVVILIGLSLFLLIRKNIRRQDRG